MWHTTFSSIVYQIQTLKYGMRQRKSSTICRERCTGASSCRNVKLSQYRAAIHFIQKRSSNTSCVLLVYQLVAPKLTTGHRALIIALGCMFLQVCLCRTSTIVSQYKSINFSSIDLVLDDWNADNIIPIHPVQYSFTRCKKTLEDYWNIRMSLIFSD